MYLVTSDTTLSGDGISTIYQKRWNVEPYHKFAVSPHLTVVNWPTFEPIGAWQEKVCRVGKVVSSEAAAL